MAACYVKSSANHTGFVWSVAKGWLVSSGLTHMLSKASVLSAMPCVAERVQHFHALYAPKPGVVGSSPCWGLNVHVYLVRTRPVLSEAYSKALSSSWYWYWIKCSPGSIHPLPLKINTPFCSLLQISANFSLLLWFAGLYSSVPTVLTIPPCELWVHTQHTMLSQANLMLFAQPQMAAGQSKQVGGAKSSTFSKPKRGRYFYRPRWPTKLGLVLSWSNHVNEN